MMKEYYKITKLLTLLDNMKAYQIEYLIINLSI